MDRSRLRIAALALVTMLAGCGWLVVNNPKRSGLDCSGSRFWPITDVLIAGAGAYVLVDQGVVADNAATLAAPAVFAASALWGFVKVGRCKRLWREATPEQIAAFHQQMAERRAAQEAAHQEWQRQQQIAQQQAYEQQLAQQQAAQQQQIAQQQAYEQQVAEQQQRRAQQQQQQQQPPPQVTPQQPPPPTNVTITHQRTVVLRGVWRTRDERECADYDFTRKTKLDAQNTMLRNRVMRDACLRCVRQGKVFILESETAPMSGCD